MKIKLLAKNFLFFLLTLFVTTSNGQILNILNSGDAGPTSGTNWSISGTTLTATGNANIQASVIETALSSGDLTVLAADINLSESINSSTANDLILKATNTIIQNSTYTVTTAGGSVTYWADSDNNGAGSVNLNNASIVTNGGDITIGGGLDPAADAAIGPYGVNIQLGSSLDAGSGAISIRGNSSHNGNFGVGVRVSNATITSGNATFFGEGTTLGAGDNYGVLVEGSTLTASGNVNITGTGGGTTGNFNHGLFYASSTFNISGSTNMVGNGGLSSGIANSGVQLNASSINGQGSGAMNITGTGGSNASSSDNDGISFNVNSTVQSGSGTMTLTGTSGSGASSEGIFFVNGTTLGHATNQTGDITVRTDLLGSSGVDVLGTGALTIEPLAAENSFDAAYTFSNITLGANLSGLTLGKAGNTADVTIPNAVNIAGPITMYGGTITLGADLTTTNSGDISLYTDNALGGLSATRNLTAAGSFKYIPSGSSFAQAVTYPITNLTVSSNGLTIGKTGNTGNITLNTALDINAIALFGGTLALNHNIDCSSLVLEGTATLAKDKYISATGNMTNNATLILSSDSNEFSRLMVDGTVSGSGTFKYQRYVAGSTTNDLISSPFPGETFGSLVTNNPNVLRTNPSNLNQYLFGPYDNDNGVYQTYLSTTNSSTQLTAGEGYRAGTTSGATLEFTGTYLTSNQTISINLGSHNTYGKWNLVGNPFPTYLDLEGFISDNSAILEDTNTAVYAYDGDDTDGSNWDIYNLANSNGVTIAPGQAFFVASSSGGGNLTFNTSRQTITGGDDFLPGLWQTPDAHAAINLKNIDQVTSTDLYINANGSLGLDPGYDAGTYANESSDFSLYTKLADGSYPDTKFAIQTIADDLSQTVVIPLGVHINAGTGYSIALDDNTLLELVRVYLKDNATGAFTLLNDGAYFFETDVDLEGALRFELYLSDQVTLGTPDESFTSFKTIYHNDEVLLVGVFQSEDTIEIYDLMGRLIEEYRPEQNGFSKLVISDQNKASGVYVARINRKGTHQSLKFLID